jgi:hypothetical protein
MPCYYSSHFRGGERSTRARAISVTALIARDYLYKRN